MLHYAFHLFRIVYHGVAAVFCVQFSSCRFVDSCVVRYALMFLQSVNLSIWFDATVHKQIGSNVTKHGSLYWCEEGGGGGGDVNATASPAPAFAYFVDCNNLTFYRRVEKEVSPLVRPFTIQFSMLVTSFFIQWFIGCVKNPRASTAPGPGSPYDATAREEERWGVRRIANVYVGNTSRDREPEIELDEASPLLGDTDTRPDPSRKRKRNYAEGVRSAGLKLWIVLVLVANAMLNVFAILGTQSRAFAELFSRVLFFYWLSMTCAVYVGFYVTRRSGVVERQSSRFTGLDYLLVFTSAGPVGFSVFTFMSVVGRERAVQGEGSAFTLAFVLFELYQACSQVTFCLYSARLDVDVEDSGIPSRNVTVFRGVIFYLAVSNGALWIANTVEGISIRQVYQQQFFGHDMWIVINNILKPLSLFFRFNSCLQFIRIYRKRSAMMTRSRPKHSHQQ